MKVYSIRSQERMPWPDLSEHSRRTRTASRNLPCYENEEEWRATRPADLFTTWIQLLGIPIVISRRRQRARIRVEIEISPCSPRYHCQNQRSLYFRSPNKGSEIPIIEKGIFNPLGGRVGVLASKWVWIIFDPWVRVALRATITKPRI